ncbi:MAG: HAMP domain-containing histidine kinase [Herbiconiux sp.]|uniref:sensor histidine kinase n=1 Tax=Herbiconiux sp. TaxID=1871186 RepID=UPI0012103D80|nr:HAMP domain-containing sensor histidine kinase [Herbiconiux sp.]TAJ47914.1 MAG: HAMP domain-containing histidine kinase [Herbiconiux sp.]
MTDARPTRRPWTLSRRLVVGTAALVASVFVVVGIASIATLSSSVTTVVDTQLTGSMSALSHSVEKFRIGSSGSSESDHPEKPFVDYTGHGPGAFIALIQADGTVADSARFSDEDAQTLDPVAIAQIEAADLEVGTHENIELTGLGSYRIATQYDSAGDILVAGASMATADSAVMQEAITIVILGLVAIALIVAGVVVIVRLALRPLGRVVGTAVEVAGLPLDRGDVVIAPRVHASDTDPRTEVGKVGEALNLLLAHVDDALAVRAAADKRMRRFVTDASHELRTPLAAIQGYAELTRQDAESLPDITEYSLARIESEAKRMNSLVSDLLLLARLDEGQDLHLDEIDLGEIAVNAVSDARATAPTRPWAVQVPDAPALVTGDRERLHQVVLNLLSNAVVHTPEGTSITTSVSFPDGGDVVELRVSDDGPGIPADLQPELFERFARGDSSRSRRSGSTGLGLAIVSSIVEAHEGDITVDSSPEGTTFILRFARLPGASPAPQASTRASASA